MSFQFRQENRHSQKLRVFKQFAINLGALSCCKKKDVGCIIFPEDYSRVLAIGYNGPPRGLPNFSCTAEEYCGCVHAEANALLKLDATNCSSAVLLCTLAPCERCSALIINSGCISKVLYITPHTSSAGLNLLHKGKIDCVNV